MPLIAISYIGLMSITIGIFYVIYAITDKNIFGKIALACLIVFMFSLEILAMFVFIASVYSYFGG